MAEIFYTNTGDSYTHLKEAIKTAFNRNVMTKIKIKKTKKNDWMNKNVISRIKRGNVLHKRHKKNPNDVLEEAFRYERNRVFGLIQVTKGDYYYQLFKDCKGKSLKMWQFKNNLTNNNIKKTYASSKLKASTASFKSVTKKTFVNALTTALQA